MIREESNLVVADNTGAKIAKCFRVLGQRKEFAHIGDVIRVSIREASPTGAVKKGQVCLAVIVRTAAPIRRKDGSTLSFDQNAWTLQIAVPCPVGQHWRVERDIRSRVKARFDREGIVMPHYAFPKQ